MNLRLSTKIFIFSLFFCTFCANAQNNSALAPISPLSANMQNLMRQTTWHNNCPVPLQDLVAVQVNYWGFDQQTHQGTLIVNKKAASDVIAIFHQLWLHHFPIASIRPIEFYQGNDQRSMLANNTSAFDCRMMTGNSHKVSLHSYGMAIDINPVQNPYHNNQIVLPPTGRNFLNRSTQLPGMILANSIVYKAFNQYGWQWGGNWKTLKDYAHFEKMPN